MISEIEGAISLCGAGMGDVVREISSAYESAREISSAPYSEDSGRCDAKSEATVDASVVARVATTLDAVLDDRERDFLWRSRRERLLDTICVPSVPESDSLSFRSVRGRAPPSLTPGGGVGRGG